MKVLIVLTNVEKYEKIERPTGLWLSELTHFYDVLVKNGIDADFVSPKGGYVPLEPQSVLNMDEIDWAYYKDEDFRNRALGNTLRPDDVDAKDYAAVYYAGGHGTMWDFQKQQILGKLLHKSIEMKDWSQLFVTVLSDCCQLQMNLESLF